MTQIKTCMSRFLNRNSFFAGIFTLVSLVCFAVRGQDVKSADTKDAADSFDIRKASFFLPQPLPASKYSHMIGLDYVVVPREWTLDIINAPMLYYAGKFTLPYGFNVQTSLSTLFVSYRFLLGPYWNYSINNFSFGAGWQVAFNYGILNQFGFNTKLVIWEQEPSLSVGYSFKKFSLTLKASTIWTNAYYENQGGHVVPHKNSFDDGYSVGAIIEQRLWKNRILSFGAKTSFLRYHIIAWPAFPVNQYRYWVPEFFIGLSL